MQALLYIFALLFLFVGGFAALPSASLPSSAREDGVVPLVRLTPAPAIARYAERYRELLVGYAGIAPAPAPARQKGSAETRTEEEAALNTPSAPSTRTVASVPAAANTAALSAGEILAATNREREKQGRAPLAWNAALSTMAEKKARDILARQYFDHVSPSGESIVDLAAEEGYAYLTLAENLALGEFTSSEAVVEAWMKSEGHRANILNPALRELGVGVAKGEYEGVRVWVAVQEFGIPRAICPTPDAALRESISKREGALESELAEITRLKSLLAASDSGDPSYGVRVDAYNAAVARYNTLVVSQKKEVALYNQGVNAYNACLQKETGAP